MKNARKIVAIVVVLSFLVSMTANAAHISANDNVELKKETQIKELLAELNDLALQQNMINSQRSKLSTSEYVVTKTGISQKQEELEDSLSALGAKILDPDNEDDMERFATVVYGSPARTDEASSSVATLNSLPNLSQYARCYTITEVEDTVLVDGEYYDTVTYYVTDNKNTGGLTKSGNASWFTTTKSTLIEDLLSYNFGFLFSSFLGEHDLVIADWILGNLFPVFNSFDDDVVVSLGGGNAYSITVHTVVQMAFHYVYLPGMMSWTACGSTATYMSGTRSDAVHANVGGQSVADSTTKSFSAVIDTPVDYYVETYLLDGYRECSTMGILILRNTWSNERFSFVPASEQYISDLDLN